MRFFCAHVGLILLQHYVSLYSGFRALPRLDSAIFSASTPVPSPEIRQGTHRDSNHMMFNMSPDATPFVPLADRSEGYSPTMGVVGVRGSDHWLPSFPTIAPTKSHGFMPLMRSHSPGHQHSANHKRSRIRAYRRACIHGFAWYRGQCVTPHAFQDLGPPARYLQSIPSLVAPPKCKPNLAHAPQSRIVVLQWNPGGLSSARYREFLSWCTLQKIDLVCLSETRWPFESEWQDEHWTALHSGQDGSQGIAHFTPSISPPCIATFPNCTCSQSFVTMSCLNPFQP